MYRTFFVFLKCTIQGGPNFLHLWLKFLEGIDKYWIVPVRKLFYCNFHHCAPHNLMHFMYEKRRVSIEVLILRFINRCTLSSEK